MLQNIHMAVERMVLLVSDLLDSSQQVLVLAEDVLQEGLLELGDLAGFHFIQVSPHTSIDDCHLLFNGHWS